MSYEGSMVGQAEVVRAASQYAVEEFVSVGPRNER
jgi:hypothetical protein